MQEDVGPRAGTHYALMRGPTARMKVGDKIRTTGNKKRKTNHFEGGNRRCKAVRIATR
jgi:hypothetical protein